ncbi:MAG: response regulator [Halarcobacter sp.]
MEKDKILIVEDESIIALQMKRTLEKFDFEITDTAIDYDSALNSIKQNRPDLILMDICLKNSKDGIEIVKEINIKDEIPVIYLSGQNDAETVNRAIATNPISYLAKPFNKEELKFNILLGLYKSKNEKLLANKKDSISLGYEYYYNKDKLFYKNEHIRLTKKELMLLKILLDAEGKIVDFKDLEKQIWPNKSICNSTLRTLIYRLKLKLDSKILETIPTQGCRLVYL